MQFGIITGGRITNVIEAESEETARQVTGGDVVYGVGIGWLLDGGAWVAPTDVVLSIEERREGWVASPAQIRLTLLQMDLLGTVQAIADADPQASIVWQYAGEIRRNNDLITALGINGGFTEMQIDDIFQYAMTTVI
jgi:hypothetical protein